ncbi:transcription-repair coupling factor [Marinobacterium mangrovicola]|uniref:Transcription-repair-coupling factor n=1 Tax=Marinobacterium mangrovicola TaxID=1476959 RepID=A0A4R1GKD6_9GAMM|nr:transcription-repair coupling factor [Marinobacterium mangrovicola]TCK08877.1 transcription-repair coupling factor [Marinobacterium mangrovicola]
MPVRFEPSVPQNPGDVRRIGQVNGSATGLLIESLQGRHKGPILMVCRDSESAARVAGEIGFYCGSDIPVSLFPDWETLPYDNFSPHQDIISTRLEALFKLPAMTKGVLVIPASTLMQRIAPPSFVTGNSLWLEKGQTINPEQMRQQLSDAGYSLVDTVYEHGEFAIRGALIDLFPMGSDIPYRIDLFDDEIDTLRTFDPETQRSVDHIDKIRLLPAREYPFHKDAITRFKQRWRESFDVDYTRCPMYQDISSGLTPAGIEYYLPLFFDDCATLFDYLPANTLLVQQAGLNDAAQQFWREVGSRYEERAWDVQRPVLKPETLFLAPDTLNLAFKAYPALRLNPEAEENRPGRDNLPCQEPPSLTAPQGAQDPLSLFKQLHQNSNQSLLICAESAGRRESLITLAQRSGLKLREYPDWQAFSQDPAALGITVYPLEHGLNLEDVQVVTETQLFGQQVFQRRRREREQTDSDQSVRHLSELEIGAPVVHIDHGVGRYLGLQTIETDGEVNEFLTLEYANNAKLYVPVSSLHLISRYSGASDEAAPLHRLGTEQWSKARRKAAEKVRDSAAELLDIYARRAAREGHSFECPEEDYQKFATGFPFEETPDQANAIEAVVRDMRSSQPMDRLVCGDVGFGKTEVAMRAAFIAVQAGQQVAVLVPTTLLAQQHFDNFRDRFADWPVNVELISRFRSAKQQQTIAGQVSEGQVDILIGTHKLLQGDLEFKQLGLVIIDEEHRFGVQQKERLKSLRAEVDILTLTATPIPRTLNMAMSGMRDLSIIATPPARRLSIKTFVRESAKPMLKEAILRELLRGGQVYFLHNEVKSIEKTAAEISELVPEARVAIGHGQMRERELEQVMTDFYHKRFNVLVCTTIIETGIDVPNANTIIIERADKFGLAQLHQLRGRVGRSHHQAYAYLLTPPPKVMTPDATKRLEAISLSNTLGAGFTLATHDLEIRGAGELLGEEQSGQIQSIGFSLYMEMLDQAIKSIREGKTPNLDQPMNHGSDINLRVPALIPDDYLPDVHNRLIMYKRISNASDERGLDELQVEMIDRFGILPQPTRNLFRLTAVKLRADKLGIAKLEANDRGGRIEFTADTQVEPLTLVMLVQQQPNRYKLDGANALRFTLPMAKPEDRFHCIEGLLGQLTPNEGD